MKIFLSIVFCLASFVTDAQKNIFIRFHHVVNDKELKLYEHAYYLKSNGDMTFHTLKYYVSAVELWKENKLVFKEANSYHLIDVDEENSFVISLNKLKENISFDQIKFNIGIDSVTNADGAKSGDLDPAKGMYWTWQSGYINFKLEGESPKCPTRKNEFEFHIGGYQKPFYPLQKISLMVKNSANIDITADIAKLIDNINLATQYNIMLPSKEAMDLAAFIPKMFSIKTK